MDRENGKKMSYTSFNKWPRRATSKILWIQSGVCPRSLLSNSCCCCSLDPELLAPLTLRIRLVCEDEEESVGGGGWRFFLNHSVGGL